MRISTINVPSVMLEAKLFENPKLNTNAEELIKPKRTKRKAETEPSNIKRMLDSCKLICLAMSGIPVPA